MVLNCALLIRVAGRLAHIEGASAFPTSDLDSPDSAPSVVVDFRRAEQLAVTEMRRRIYLEPVGELSEILVDSSPGLASRAVEGRAMVFALNRVVKPAKSATLEA